MTPRIAATCSTVGRRSADSAGSDAVEGSAISRAFPRSTSPGAPIRLFNVHVDTRRLRRGGSYFLTYHRWARREQVEAAYPQFAELLRRKMAHDPEGRFQSDWWRHYHSLFADRLQG